MKGFKHKGFVFFLIYLIIVVLAHIIPLGDKIGSINKVEIEVVSLRLDYLLHAVLFIPWAITTWWVYDVSFQYNIYKAFIWLIAGVFFAAGCEAVQYFLNYRAFNINDLIGNVIGIFIGSIIYFFNRRK